MHECPVCNSPLNEDSASDDNLEDNRQYCPVCGWALTPPDWSQSGWETLESDRINWARQMWQWWENADRSDSTIESRLDEINSELQAARTEREQLFAWVEWMGDRLETGRLEPGDESGLDSEVGIDYVPLQELLAAGEWQQADEMTWWLMLQGSDREAEGWLRGEDIDRFPCTDLQAIAWLWDAYSEGRFGLHVQRSVWAEVGQNYTDFCDRVGWRSEGKWLYYSDLSFNPYGSVGHLPVIGWRRRSCYGTGEGTARDTLVRLLERLNICESELQDE